MSVSNLINLIDHFNSFQQPKSDPLSELDAKTNKVALESLTPKEEKLLRKWQDKYLRKENYDLALERNKDSNYIFRGISGINTLNKAKINELAKYILQARHPFTADQFKKLASKFNVAPLQGTFKVSPFEYDGACHEAVLGWLKTENSQWFEGGMPIEVVNRQYLYENYVDAIHLIIPMLDNPDLEKDNVLQLEKSFGESYVQLYTIFKNFVKDSSFPDDELFYDLIHTAFTDETRKELFTTLYLLYSENQKGLLRVLDREKFSFALNNLALKEVIHKNTTGLSLINSLSSLDPGHYHITIPTFERPGERDGMHALGLIIKEDGNFAFFDPNYRIIESDKSKLKSMIVRDLLIYSGIDRDLLEVTTREEKKEIIKSMGSYFSLYRLERNDR